MNKQNFEYEEDVARKKQAQRARKGKLKMKVSGGSVKGLQKLIAGKK